MRALVDLREQGLVRSIGVSNFTGEHLERIIETTGVAPSVNQIELHPHFPQQPLRRVNQDLGIRTEAWSPTGKGCLLNEQPITAAAAAHDVTPRQVVLRWHVRLGSLAIPKSGDQQRQRQTSTSSASS